MTDTPEVEQAFPDAKLAAKDTFRILIMDTVDHVNEVKAACKNAGLSVVPAHSLEEAFAFLDEQDHADVIICAAYLEDQSLFEFLKRLRANAVHKHTMFMTLALAPGPMAVRTKDSTERASRLLGADAFINMPEFDAEKLIAEIKKLLPDEPLLEKSKQGHE